MSILRLTLGLAAALVVAGCTAGAAEPPSTRPPVVATLPPANATALSAATPTPPATASVPGTPGPSQTAASATPTSSPGAASGSLVAKGKVVWETVGGVGCQSCHGVKGTGGVAKDGTTAPNIRGATEQKLRDALRGGAALMTNLKLSDEEIEAVMAYLAYLDLQ